MKTRRLFAALLFGAGLALLPASAVFAQTDDHSEEPASASQETGEHEVRGHAEEECIHLLEEGGKIDDCQEAPSLIMPATNELVWGGLAFLIVFGALAKLGYPAVKKAMEDRSNRIRESIDDADRAKNEAQGVLDEYQRQLADARSEANRIIEEARQTADQLRRDLVQRAEQEAQETRQRTAEDIDAAKARAMSELQANISDLTIDLAEKVVQRQLDRDTNRALIDGFIADLQRN